MTPRASTYERPSLPKGSRTKTVSGPTKSSNEKSSFDPSYQDRAMERRKEQKQDDGNRSVRFDFEEIEKQRKLQDTNATTAGEPENNYETGLSPFAKSVLRAMSIITPEEIESSTNLWEPGKASLVYDAKKYGKLPQMQIRSNAEVEALGVAHRSAQQKDLEIALIRAVGYALGPKKDMSTSVVARNEEDDFDMFATIDKTTQSPAISNKHKERLRAKENSAEDYRVELPKSVDNIISQVKSNQELLVDGESDGDKDIVDDYGECYPGVFEAAGLEYESDEEDRRKKPKRESDRRKFNREASQIEKIMKDKYNV